MIAIPGAQVTLDTAQVTPTTLPVSTTPTAAVPFTARKYDPRSLAEGIPLITRTLTGSLVTTGSAVSGSGRLFVIDQNVGLRVFDLATWALLGTITLVDLDPATAICYAPTTNRIYVTVDGNPGVVKVIDPDSGAAGAVVGTLTMDPAALNLKGIVWVPTQNCLFVTTTVGLQKVTALTTTGGTVSGVIATTDSGPVGIVYCPSNDRVYVSFPAGPSVRAYNPSSNAETPAITSGLTANVASMAYCPINDRIYAVCYGTGNGVATSIAVINPANGSVTSITVATYRPYGICFNPQTGLLYVTVYGGGNALLVVNPTQNTVFAAPETYPTIAAVQTVPFYIPHVGCIAVPCGNTSTLIVG